MSMVPVAHHRSKSAASRTSMCDRAQQFIKRQILTRKTLVDAQINEREIAEWLCSTRTLIRAAIRPLGGKAQSRWLYSPTSTPEELPPLTGAVKDMEVGRKADDFAAWVRTTPSGGSGQPTNSWPRLPSMA